MNRLNKKSLLSILVAISMSLTGCSSLEDRNNTNDSKMQVTNIDDMEVAYSESSAIMPETTDAPVDTLAKSYLSYFKSLNFQYNHEELYPNQKTLNSILKADSKLQECNYEFDGDVKSLVDKIKENTGVFIKENSEYINPFILYNFEYQRALTKVITSIKNNCQNNISEDFHQISNMAFVIGTTKHFASNEMDYYVSYYEDGLNVIIVNQKYLEDLIEMHGYPYEKFLYYIISHEVNHTRENVCPCNYEHEYDNIGFNHEGYSFILEAAAESDLYNTREFSEILASFLYSDERKAEGELLLLGILNDSLDDYYNAIFDIDRSSLFEFFDLNTTEEKIDFLRMLYAIDGIFYRNDLTYNLLAEGDIKSEWINDIKRAIGLTYKENIFKHCMINLIEYTSSHEDFSLQENLIILNIIKAYLIDGTCTFDVTTGQLVYDQEVLTNIAAMENSYIEYLSKKYQTSIEKIREYENTEIAYIIEAAKYILEDEDVDFGTYSSDAKNIMSKFPVIRGVLMTNLNMPYNVYETRMATLELTPTEK